MILWSIYASFFKIGLVSFGGGYAMIPLMRIEFIENQGWLTASQFMEIIAISEMTPGPIAVNTATFIGYQVGGLEGAILATAGVISPSVIILLAIIYLAQRMPNIPYQEAIIQGIRLAAIALIGMAALYLGEAVMQDLYTVCFFIGSLTLYWLTRVNPLLVIALSGFLSLLVSQIC